MTLAAIPSFLNSGPAAIAAAIAVPSLLILYFLKLRRREVTVPSTLLWKKAIQDLQVNAPFQRLRKNLLLLLQLLLLLLLALAFSRPVMNFTPGAGKLAVIAIDHSASMSAMDMNGKSRLEEAKRLARELVDGMGKEAAAMVIAFDDSADIKQSFTTDHTMLKKAIDSIQPTDRLSRLDTAYRLAEAKAISFTPEQLRSNQTRPELWVYSDGRVADRNELSLSYADLKYTKVGTAEAQNIGIVALSAKRNYERPTDVQIFARLANYGPSVVKAVVQLSVDGAVVPQGVKRGLSLFPERWTTQQREKAEKEDKLLQQDSVEFNIELTKAAVIRIDLKENPGDVLVADNSAQIVVPPPRSLNVMLVSKKGNLWLEHFLESANLKNPSTITPEAYEEKMKDPQALAAAIDVILFDRYNPKSLPPSGNFIYNNCYPPNSKLKPSRDETGVDQIAKDQVVLDWDRNHPILRYSNMRFYATEVIKMQVPLEAQVLIEGRDVPMSILYRDGRSTHLVFPFDVQESTWPTARSFPVFFDNALQYLALGSEMDIRQSFQPGATPKIPRYYVQQANAKKVTVSGPDDYSVTVPVPDSGDFALPPLEKVGLYRLDPPIPQFERLAVNLLDENESNLLPLDDAPGGTKENVVTTGGKSRMELWWWIVACAALPLCFIEWWVYTRRVHL